MRYLPWLPTFAVWRVEDWMVLNPRLLGPEFLTLQSPVLVFPIELWLIIRLGDLAAARGLSGPDVERFLRGSLADPSDQNDNQRIIPHAATNIIPLLIVL